MFVFLMITMNYVVQKKQVQVEIHTRFFPAIVSRKGAPQNAVRKNWFSKAVYFPSNQLTGKPQKLIQPLKIFSRRHLLKNCRHFCRGNK